MRRLLIHHRTNGILARCPCLIIVLQIACAGPGPDLFPPEPMKTQRHDNGIVERIYDLNHDDLADYAEELSPAGRVTSLRYLRHQNGSAIVSGISNPANDNAESMANQSQDISQGDIVKLNEIADTDRRHLLIILDSIPFEMVRDLWNQGRFRLFYPPTRVISPFPVMTDLALSEFFGASPCPGVESQFYDGHHLTNGYLDYADEVNTPWMRFADYHLNPIAHSEAYGHPREWFAHELRQIQDAFLARFASKDIPDPRNPPDCFVGYCVGTSALGARYGRNGHQAGLIQMDRFCQYLFYAAAGRLQITLMSDHGHNLVRSRRIPLPDELRHFGYHVTDRLIAPNDVVVPEFGVVTCAAIHTHRPASVAGDVVGIEGIDLAAYLDDSDQVVVLSRDGHATISFAKDRYRYLTQWGDPLNLSPVIDRLRRDGRVDSEGFLQDRVLFDATANDDYPDAVHRLWRAFHGLVVHTPDVLVSVKDGWHCGSAFMSQVLDLAAAHGNLGPLSSTAFVMTTAGQLPPVLRTEDLRGALIKLGVPLDFSGEDNP